MSKNLNFAQKMIKLWVCQISQNKKTPCRKSKVHINAWKALKPWELMQKHAKLRPSMPMCLSSTPKHSKHSVAFKITQKHTKVMTFSHLFENFVTTFPNLLLFLQIINFMSYQTHRLKYLRAPEVDLS